MSPTLRRILRVFLGPSDDPSAARKALTETEALREKVRKWELQAQEYEAMGLFELFPDTAIVGGRILRDHRVLSAASYFGFGRGCDSPDRGRAVHDPGYFAQMWKPHSASAVPVHHCVVDASFFREFVSHDGHAQVSMRHLGAWLGAFARARGRRVIYTPFLGARATADLEGSIVANVRAHCPIVPLRAC